MEYITFWRTLPNGAGLVTLELYEDNQGTSDDPVLVKVCGIHHIEGQLRLPPKKWLQAIRAELKIIEGIARDAGCAEMRLAGRNWSRVLTDYEPLPGIENRLRKVL